MPATVRPLSVVGLVLAMGPSRWIVIVAFIRQYVAAGRTGSLRAVIIADSYAMPACRGILKPG
jgi:hypothetical protein